MKKTLSFLLLAIYAVCSLSAAHKNPRIKLNFDFDWKFSLEDNPSASEIDFNDSEWDSVQLPHDWNIKQNFDSKGDGSAAYLPDGKGWYRKTFTLPIGFKCKDISVIFDGIFMQSDVYINGHHLGFHPYGFTSVIYDLTPYLKEGENTIAVRVDTTDGRPRWYSGAGIYRHAWLQATNPVRITDYGTYITTPEVSDESASVNIVSSVFNNSAKGKKVVVVNQIFGPDGKTASKPATEKINVLPGDTINLIQNLTVANPRLWDIENPAMYSMQTTLNIDGKTVDVYETPFGIRSAEFNPEKGFLLNGKQLKLQGMCLHQDAGSLGVAVPDRSYERRLEILKEYGCNAIRSSHNPPSPEFLDMCDRMGFIVIDEAFDKWCSGYYEKYYDEWWRKDMADMLYRDRNHPSIVLWSIGNELKEAWNGDDVGVERAGMMQDFVHKLEPTRPVTMACQNNHQAKFADVVDVLGYNYLEARMLSEKKTHPERMCLVSEELPYYRGEEGNIRSYTPLNPWQIVRDNDFVAGGFIWSGVDYLGEAGWPSKGWPTGLFDICMNEKPRAAYHRAVWNKTPMVSIAVVDPSLDIDHGRDLWQWPNMASVWNFPDSYNGLVMEVRTTTNCESVELFLNDKSMGKHNTEDFTNNTILWCLPYNPGKLVAVGYNGDEKVAEYALVTTGKTCGVKAFTDRDMIKADGQDLSHISVELIDNDGNLVQTDDRKVTVTVDGDAKFLGIDSGDLRREKSFAGNELKTYFGKALITLQSTLKKGKAIATIRVEGVDEPTMVEINTI